MFQFQREGARKAAAVIVEPRVLPTLEYSIRSTMHHLLSALASPSTHIQWKFRVYHSVGAGGNENFLRRVLADVPPALIKFVPRLSFGSGGNGGSNQLFKSNQFWKPLSAHGFDTADLPGGLGGPGRLEAGLRFPPLRLGRRAMACAQVERVGASQVHRYVLQWWLGPAAGGSHAWHHEQEAQSQPRRERRRVLFRLCGVCYVYRTEPSRAVRFGSAYFDKAMKPLDCTLRGHTTTWTSSLPARRGRGFLAAKKEIKE